MNKYFVISMSLLLCLLLLVCYSNNKDNQQEDDTITSNMKQDNHTITNNMKQDNFLITSGDYSITSSTWGIGIEIDSKTEFPKNSVIEWIISDGIVRSLDESTSQPKTIQTTQAKNPFTHLNDQNNGAVIWSPDNFKTTRDISIEAYIYESENRMNNPIGYSKITLENDDGTFHLKTDVTK